MNDLHGIGAYFGSVDPILWRWMEEGRVVAWSSGATIAFREEIQIVLERLAPSGAPPFGAIVLLLAACRERTRPWSFVGRDPTGEESDYELFGEEMYPLWIHLKNLPRPLTTAQLESLEGKLAAVNALPAECRESPPAKAALAAAVFERSPYRLPKEQSERLLGFLRQGEAIGPLLPNQATLRLHEAGQAVFALFTALQRFDVAAWPLRFRTSLDALPRPAEEVELPGVRARRLMNELRDDPDLGGMAQTAHDLLAAVYLPRRLASPDNMPLGGASDLTNRGPLDRLLISELAQDDLTLAVRVALGEALYLRREEPPQMRTGARLVFLHDGLRLWGVPRVFALSVALALTAGSGPKQSVSAFRPEGDALTPIDLGTREGVVGHLERLGCDLHPGEAFPALAAAAKAEQAGEVVIVTSEDVFADAEFQEALGGLIEQTPFLATVARDGRFRLRQLHGRRTTLVREALLDLEKLLSRPAPRATGGADAISRPSLPMIFSVRPFPLLLPHLEDARRTCWTANGVFTLTADKRLMFWRKKGEGARQITDAAPGGRLLYFEADDEEVVTIVTGLGAGRPLHIVNADRTAVVSQRFVGLEGKEPQTVAEVNGVLMVVAQTSAFAIGARTGGVLGSSPIPGALRDTCGRFVRTDSGWFALDFDGDGPSFASVPLDTVRAPHRKIRLFVDRPSFDGPWAVFEDRSIASTTTGDESSFPLVDPAYTPKKFSRDGSRLLFTAAGRPGLVVDFSTGRKSNPETLEKCPVVISSVAMRKKLVAAGWTAFGRLALQGHTGRILLVEPRKDEKRLELHRMAENADGVATMRPFERMSSPEGTGYTLSVAQWEDGRRVILDSRGLLHLQDENRRLPELTLAVPNDRPLAAWDSRGNLHGDPFFIGADAAQVPAKHFWDLLKQYGGATA